MVSIIIATFNSSKTLYRALDSVLKQEYPDWECIVVDGASNDDTLSIVYEFEKRDSRFSHISEPDKGIYDAFNKGWRIAHGEWIYFLGSDDAIVKNGFARILETPSPADVLYGSVYGYAYGGKRIKPGKFRIIKHVGDMVSHQGILMKRTLIESLGGFDMQYKVSADFDLVTRSLIKGAIFEMRPVYLSYFSTGGVSGTMGDLRDGYKICMRYTSCPNKVRIFYAKLFVQKWFWIHIKWPLVEVLMNKKNS